MRQRMILLALAVLVFQPGCGTTRFNWLKPPEKSPPPGKVPTTAELVDFLNNNANRIQSLRCEDIAVTATQKSQSFGLMAQMVVQKPRNFRMSARVAGKDMVDLGSNDQEFWFWSSQDKDPCQYYCAYQDWHEGRGRGLNFPFQPEWIVETLGLGPYGPAEKYKLEHNNETVSLVEKTVTPQGKPVRKVIVFNRRFVQPPQPPVNAYLLVDDATGKEICSAHITEVQLDQARTNAILPRKVELRWPAMDVRMALKMDHLEVNGGAPSTAFIRPRLGGIPSINLATGRPDPQIQPVEGTVLPKELNKTPLFQ